jgi:hypothetical protein
VVECAALEMQCTGNRTVGSNPTLSARSLPQAPPNRPATLAKPPFLCYAGASNVPDLFHPSLGVLVAQSGVSKAEVGVSCLRTRK